MRKKRTNWPQTVFVGDVSQTKSGPCKLVEYRDSLHCIVEFENGYTTECQASNFKRGQVSNPLHPSLCGVGYMGLSGTSERGTISFSKWNAMIQRCYGEDIKNKHYLDCSVCEDWHNYQNFKTWFLEQVGCDNRGWHLDKDLINKNNTLYSPENCAIIPHDVNYFLILRQKGRGDLPIGVTTHRGKFYSQISTEGKQRCLGKFDKLEDAFGIYKQVKEAEAKRLAIKYGDKLDSRVYEALMNFKVEIGD